MNVEANNIAHDRFSLAAARAKGQPDIAEKFRNKILSPGRHKEFRFVFETIAPLFRQGTANLNSPSRAERGSDSIQLRAERAALGLRSPTMGGR